MAFSMRKMINRGKQLWSVMLRVTMRVTDSDAESDAIYGQTIYRYK